MNFSITPSHIIEYLYCPRFTWFEFVLAIPQYEEKDYKVMRGRHLHDQKLEQNKAYLRKRIGAVAKHQEIYLTNAWLRGKVDEVLELKDGSMSPLDYKFAVYKDKIFNTYKIQCFCYAWLIEENYQKKVNRAWLVYTRSRNKLVEIPVEESDKQLVRKASREIKHIITQNFYPKATKYKKRCLTCTYSNICEK